MNDSTRVLRVRVLRRVVYGLNAVALDNDRVPPEGLFDVALCNGLAAIIAAKGTGAEYGGGHVRPPRQLLDLASNDLVELGVNVRLLKDAIELSQPVRHGRTDDEWTRITRHHVDELIALDLHPCLDVMTHAKGATFDELVVSLYQQEVDEILPVDPKERYSAPEPGECPECWRRTLVGSDADEFGIGLAEGATCIACGYIRSHDDVIADAMRVRLDGD